MKTSWIVLIGSLLLMIDVLFQGGGPLFSFLFFAICIYFGRKGNRFFGKLLFWFGVIGLVFTLLSLVLVRLLIVILLAYWLVKMYQSKKAPHVITPVFEGKPSSQQNDFLVKKELLFKNRWFGRQETPSSVYEWNDIVIHCGIGDYKIDLSNTVLPTGESVIMISSLIGHVELLLPYETSLSLQHSVMFGNTTVFEQRESQAFNATFSYETQEYGRSPQRIKVITKMLIGDVEVKRV
ncbi:cell wall-active antibiotics response protein [Fictibacillus macauensis ZFHKF-1]|uniref:Cell wall-active antibiotics response protein n=1 Tax=Fictibacillus macauensis ZFHKF-1 TaxID=1196324 RepID=I8J2Q3_9BACL|nr:cell wall-active antibiotics response protein LiaF [Fictibacillus macauensis]EIT86021.1 cell wall-active antibiotics response protein [Fictibacillus macauensis ZFHKF-1]